MLARILISIISAVTAVASLWLAHAITEEPHPMRWLLAIGVLEPIALFAGFNALAVFSARYRRWFGVRRPQSALSHARAAARAEAKVAT